MADVTKKDVDSVSRKLKELSKDLPEQDVADYLHAPAGTTGTTADKHQQKQNAAAKANEALTDRQHERKNYPSGNGIRNEFAIHQLFRAGRVE